MKRRNADQRIRDAFRRLRGEIGQAFPLGIFDERFEPLAAAIAKAQDEAHDFAKLPADA